MTVERLMKELHSFNPKAIVKLHHRDGEPVLFALSVVGDEERVWIECESDNDMGVELEARFEYAVKNQIDELDFYMNLLEVGIDATMVRKYMGDERADIMQRFCEDHGLI